MSWWVTLLVGLLALTFGLLVGAVFGLLADRHPRS